MKRFLYLVVFLGLSSVAYAGGPLGLGLVSENPNGLTLKYKPEHQPPTLRLGLARFSSGFVLFRGNYFVLLGRLPFGLNLDLLRTNLDIFVKLSPEITLQPEVAVLFNGVA